MAWYDDLGGGLGAGMLGLGGLQSAMAAYAQMQQAQRQKQLMAMYQNPQAAQGFMAPLDANAINLINQGLSANLAQRGLGGQGAYGNQQIADAWAKLALQREQQGTESYFNALRGASQNIPQAPQGGGLMQALMMMGFLKGKGGGGDGSPYGNPLGQNPNINFGQGGELGPNINTYSGTGQAVE